MSNVTRVGRFMFDTKTQTEWERLNPVLLKGELVLEYDTKLMKIGDGITKYNRLPYANRGKDGVGVTPEQQEMLEQFDVLLEKSVNKEYLNDKLALYVKEVDISDYISRKADITYVDEKLLTKADKTYVDEKLLDTVNRNELDTKADTTDLVNYAKISQLNELKAELLLAIKQGEGEAIKVYADIFSLGNSDVNDIILNTGKIGLVLKDITQSELNIWEELTTMEDVINSEDAMNAVANSTTAMNAVANSTSAWNSVMNNTTAFNTVINSTSAMNAVANSTSAMNAVINSTSAMNAVINSTSAMNAVANSTSAMNAVANSTSALQAIGDSDKAMLALINSPKTLSCSGKTGVSRKCIILSNNKNENVFQIILNGQSTKIKSNNATNQLSNGHWNILQVQPNIVTFLNPMSDRETVYYYPLD